MTDRNDMDKKTDDHNAYGPHEQQPNLPPEPTREMKLKSSQSLITVALIGGPVSLLFGGVLLSGVALICALIAHSKLKSIPTSSDQTTIEFRLKRQALFVTAICAATLVLNAVSLAASLPMLMEMIQNGQLDASLAQSGAGPQSSSSSSVWG